MKSIIHSMLLILFIGTFTQPALAGMVGTQQLITGPAVVDTAPMRADIEKQLVELGVEPHMAAQRAAGFSDQQVIEITQRLSDLPAGASVGGVILTVFIVFVITDVIGATDIFPFIKPVR